MRCAYFQRDAGVLTWDVTAQELRDTQAGTGGSLPHMSQVTWRFEREATDEEPPPPEAEPRRRRTMRTEDLGQSSKRARREPTLEEGIEEAARRFPTLSGEAASSGEGAVDPDVQDEDGDHKMGHLEETAMLDIMLLYSNEGNVCGGGHISEVYSPPRVAPLAAKYQLEQGYSLDLTTCADDGQPFGNRIRTGT